MSKEKFETMMPHDKFSPEMGKEVARAIEDLKENGYEFDCTMTADDIQIDMRDSKIRHLTKIGDEMPFGPDFYDYDLVLRSMIMFPDEKNEQEEFIHDGGILRQQKKDIQKMINTTKDNVIRGKLQKDINELNEKEDLLFHPKKRERNHA